MMTCFWPFRMWFGVMLCGAVSAFAELEPTENTPISKTGEAVEGLTITAETPKPSYRFGEALLLTVRMKNVGEKEWVFRKGMSHATMYTITVKGEDGTEMPKTRFGQKQAWAAAFLKGFIKLAPGQEHSVTLPVNRLFDMTLAGKYMIAVGKTITAQDDGKVTVSAPSLEVSVTEE